MDVKELKHFDQLCEVLSNKDNFFKTKVDEYHSALLSKLLALPTDKVFPCLDLYRIFCTHPDIVLHYKNFEHGWNHLSAFVRILTEKDASDPTKMLALRCMVNMFKDQSACFILYEKKQKVIEAVSPHLSSAKANVRESAITLFLNFSMYFLMKPDSEEAKILILSALGVLGNGQETNE